MDSRGGGRVLLRRQPLSRPTSRNSSPSNYRRSVAPGNNPEAPGRPRRLFGISVPTSRKIGDSRLEISTNGPKISRWGLTCLSQAPQSPRPTPSLSRVDRPVRPLLRHLTHFSLLRMKRIPSSLYVVPGFSSPVGCLKRNVVIADAFVHRRGSRSSLPPRL